MKNVQYKIDGGKLVIEVDLTQRFGLSKSGKTIMIASTEGNKEIDSGIYLGLNIYTYEKGEKK
jgi:hypothetical protein